MPSIVDMILVGELALVVAATMQIIKSHPKMLGSAVPYVSGIFGIVACLLWFTVTGELYHEKEIDWINLYRSFAIGIIAAVTSIMGYNLQKALPTPNLLPTSNELEQQRMKEDVARTATGEITKTASISTEVVKTETTTMVDENDRIESEDVTTVETRKDDDFVG